MNPFFPAFPFTTSPMLRPDAVALLNDPKGDLPQKELAVASLAASYDGILPGGAVELLARKGSLWLARTESEILEESGTPVWFPPPTAALGSLATGSSSSRSCGHPRTNAGRPADISSIPTSGPRETAGSRAAPLIARQLIRESLLGSSQAPSRGRKRQSRRRLH